MLCVVFLLSVASSAAVVSSAPTWVSSATVFPEGHVFLYQLSGTTGAVTRTFNTSVGVVQAAQIPGKAQALLLFGTGSGARIGRYDFASNALVGKPVPVVGESLGAGSYYFFAGQDGATAVVAVCAGRAKGAASPLVRFAVVDTTTGLANAAAVLPGGTGNFCSVVAVSVDPFTNKAYSVTVDRTTNNTAIHSAILNGHAAPATVTIPPLTVTIVSNLAVVAPDAAVVVGYHVNQTDGSNYYQLFSGSIAPVPKFVPVGPAFSVPSATGAVELPVISVNVPRQTAYAFFGRVRMVRTVPLNGKATNTPISGAFPGPPLFLGNY